jgi:AraC-like DNA-binding protein
MIAPLAITLSAFVAAFSFLLLAFARKRGTSLPLQTVFALVGLNYLAFFWASITSTSYLGGVTIAVAALEGPALWWLVRSKIQENLSLPSYVHMLPAAVLPLVHWFGPDSFDNGPFILVSVSRLFYASYAGWMVYKIHRSRSESKGLVWVSILLAAAAGLSVIKLSSYVIFFLDNSWHAPDWLILLKTAGASSTALALLWWALIRPEIYVGVQRSSDKEANDFDRETFARFNILLEKERAYLRDDLSLALASEDLAVLPRELSEAVNRSSGKSFKAVVREHRIAFACSLMKSGDNDEMGILEIAYASGFATKSVFNAAFKKETGQTPSEYRKEHCFN